MYSDVTEDIITKQGIGKAVREGSTYWHMIPDPHDPKRKVIRWKSIPKKYQRELQDILFMGEDPWRAIEKYDFVRYFDFDNPMPEIDVEAEFLKVFEESYEHFAGYLNKYRFAIENEQQRMKVRRYLARAASVTVAIRDFYQLHELSASNRKPLIALSEHLAAHKEDYWPKGYRYMPTSVRHLHENLKKMLDGAAVEDVIKRPRTGNENRKGANYTYTRGVIARLLATGKNESISAIYRKVRFQLLKNDLGKVSESTVRNHVADLHGLTALQRFGIENKAAATQRFSTPMARAMFAGECWQADGTRVQLQPYDTSGRYSYLYVVAIRDVYSGAWVGWSFGLAESHLLYIQALKMAVSLTGYLPFELMYDRFPGHNYEVMETLFAQLKEHGVKLTKTSVATGKAAVERAFGTLQSVFEMDRKEWVGQGIRSTRDYARPTQEYLKKTHKELKAAGFDWEKAWMAENEVLTLYNHTPLSFYSKKFREIDQSPWEMHETETERPNVHPVEQWEIASLFWLRKRIKINHHMVTMTVNGREHIYRLTDERYYDILRSFSEVEVRYDAADMSEVMLFNPLSGELLDSVTEYERIQLYGPDAEYGRLQEEKAKDKVLKAKKAAELQEIQAGCDDNILELTMPTMLPKSVTLAAENSTTGRYLKEHPPIEPTAKTKDKRSKTKDKGAAATPKVRSAGLNELELMDYVLNQV